jgi:hypothetical protein
LLEARQYGGNDMAVQELQTRLPSMFNFTDPALIPVSPSVPLEKLENTWKATTTVRRFAHNAMAEVVFQRAHPRGKATPTRWTSTGMTSMVRRFTHNTSWAFATTSLRMETKDRPRRIAK